MSEHTWKTRIEAAIKANWIDQGHSMRELSARLGKGPNYVSQMLGDDKAPRVDFVIDLAQILRISASQVLLGVEMTADDEKLLMLASKLDPDRKRSLLDLLNSLASSEGSVP